ncbi:uncharacterized protein BX663DRAFT_539755 [Cokeromyces recurvatus]|uniref:uncharacterized protein n=1 Tax=Cokeromyces recurvatus TaxID=90255 RepID=UPI002220F487|nr:uncharacterized protein BX663DRAFT_539755 [Cokeromyces recurvatus]KAI7906981.1 hypothetical protein BX663DRAFT_539755 [Cokeromyces recurvatus]
MFGVHFIAVIASLTAFAAANKHTDSSRIGRDTQIPNKKLSASYSSEYFVASTTASFMIIGSSLVSSDRILSVKSSISSNGCREKHLQTLGRLCKNWTYFNYANLFF